MPALQIEFARHEGYTNERALGAVELGRVCETDMKTPAGAAALRALTIDRLTTNETIEGSRNGHGGKHARDDRGRQNGRKGPLSQFRDLRDRGGDRRLSAHRARAAGDAGGGARLCSDFRRRHPWPQPQSWASDRRHRPHKARAYPRHRSAAVYRAAYVASWARRPRLNHVREQRRGGGDRKSTRLNSSHVSESRMPSSA